MRAELFSAIRTKLPNCQKRILMRMTIICDHLDNHGSITVRDVCGMFGCNRPAAYSMLHDIQMASDYRFAYRKEGVWVYDDPFIYAPRIKQVVEILKVVRVSMPLAA